MTELLTVQYAQTGQSTQQNDMGMREMQARAFAARNAQYLLLKAPPASGKSRALMFLALDKIMQQGLKKAIIAVPEISIGGSFADTPLSAFGFYADWCIDSGYNLCTAGEAGKVDKLLALSRERWDAGAVDEAIAKTGEALRLDPGRTDGSDTYCAAAFHHAPFGQTLAGGRGFGCEGDGPCRKALAPAGPGRDQYA